MQERVPILVVHSDQQLHSSVRRRLRDSRFTARFCTTGRQALAACAGNPVPVVVVSLRLPEMNGFETIVRLRAMAPDTCFVITTPCPSLDLPDYDELDRSIVAVHVPPGEGDAFCRCLQVAYSRYLEGLESGRPRANRHALVVDADASRGAAIASALDGDEFFAEHCVPDRMEALGELNVIGIVLRMAEIDVERVARMVSTFRRSAVVVVGNSLPKELVRQCLRVGAQDVVGGEDDIERALSMACERKLAERRRLELGHCDPVTDLVNRRLLSDRLSIALARAKRRGAELALAILELEVDPELEMEGRHALNRAVAARLSGAVRAYDTVAHLRGPRFAILVDQLDAEPPHLVLERVVKTVGAPVEIGGASVAFLVRAGVARFPSAAETPDELVRGGLLALARARESRKEMHTFEPTVDIAGRK